MPLNQYVYFGLWSDTLTAAEIAHVLGVDPDERTVRGSRRSDPPVPVAHSWQLVCRESGLRIDEQVERVLDRVAPLASAIRSLTGSGETTAGLQLVQYFDDDSAPLAPIVEIMGENGPELAPEPSWLLGFHLRVEWLPLLADTGASLDCDEYSLG